MPLYLKSNFYELIIALLIQLWRKTLFGAVLLPTTDRTLLSVNCPYPTAYHASAIAKLPNPLSDFVVTWLMILTPYLDILYYES